MQPIGRLFVTLWQRLGRREQHPECLADPALETPPRFGEFLAASTMPEFAGLPLEFWPGYRRQTVSDGEHRAAEASNFSRSLR
jgi:hypothetical protein